MRKKPILLSLVLLAGIAAGGTWLQSSGGWQTASKWLSGTPSSTSAVKANPQAGGSGGARQAAPVEIMQAKVQDLSDDIFAIGSLVASESADIAPDSNGRLVSVSAKDAAQVQKGDELFRLDGDLIAAEARDAEARLKLAQSTFDRSQTLARSRNVAQSVLDQSAAELEVARSAVELVKLRLSRLVVRAPFDGHLGFVSVSEGSYVTAGTALVRLDNITLLKVSLSIPERYISFVAVGQDVSLSSDALPGQTFTARISAINPAVDVNGRALQVLASLDNSELLLRPGMLVRAIIKGQSRRAVTVSESAVVPQGEKLAVFEVKDDKAIRREVTTGQRRNGWVEITSGIEDGTTVVTAGATRLSDGAAVKISGQAQTQ
jgi:membrane fusion protein, multidrug efflux system